VAGLAATFGSGAMTNPIKDLLKAEVILVTGSNTTENHPIFANYIKEAVLKHNTKLIVIDPRRIDLVDFSDIWLRPNPGTDVAWLNGLMHIIINENLQDQTYIDARTSGFDKYKKCLEKYNPEYVSKITGIPEKDLYTAARMYAQAQPASILYAMGITQHTSGTDNVKSLGNLAMLCGNVGVEGGGVNPLRGQNNVQGACDMGCLPNVHTGYQKVIDEPTTVKFKDAWQVDTLSSKPGLTVTEMFSSAEDGSVKALYIMGENPLLSDPDLNHIKHCVEALDFLVVQDIFLTETAQYADVVLPAASFAEKDGTFTNSERKVQRVRKAVESYGNIKEDRNIISELAKKMGYPMDYPDAESVFNELAGVTPSYSGISYDRINETGIPWPCPTHDHPGTPTLHVDSFSHGKGIFFEIDYRPAAESTDNDYPFILTTGRVLQHFHTGTMTRKGNGLNQLYPELLAEISPEDAQEHSIIDGDQISISSRRGSIKVKTRISDRPGRGLIFVPFHFHESAVNLLTNCALDPVAKIPEYKVCAVSMKKVSEGGAG
jgi:formate dehydrogenase major subunit